MFLEIANSLYPDRKSRLNTNFIAFIYPRDTDTGLSLIEFTTGETMSTYDHIRYNVQGMPEVFDPEKERLELEMLQKYNAAKIMETRKSQNVFYNPSHELSDLEKAQLTPQRPVTIVPALDPAKDNSNILERISKLFSD